MWPVVLMWCVTLCLIGRSVNGLCDRWELGEKMVSIVLGCVIPGDEGRDGVMVPLTCSCVVVSSITKNSTSDSNIE